MNVYLGAKSTRDQYDSAPTIAQASNMKTAIERERGSVEVEFERLSAAVDSLERTVADHGNRIAAVVLSVPGTGKESANAPDTHVCDLAEGIRTQRRRVESITEALAFLTSRVDL